VRRSCRACNLPSARQKLRLLGKLAGEMRETGKCIFEKQERGCDFEARRPRSVFAVEVSHAATSATSPASA